MHLAEKYRTAIIAQILKAPAPVSKTQASVRTVAETPVLSERDQLRCVTQERESECRRSFRRPEYLFIYLFIINMYNYTRHTKA